MFWQVLPFVLGKLTAPPTKWVAPQSLIDRLVTLAGKASTAAGHPPPSTEEPEQTVEVPGYDDSGGITGGEQLSPIGPEDYFMPRFIRSIPGGAAGFAQQTPAGQRQMFGGASAGSSARKKRSSTRSSRKSTSRASGSVRKRAGSNGGAKKKARLVKGSAAAKAYMKKIRNMRK